MWRIVKYDLFCTMVWAAGLSVALLLLDTAWAGWVFLAGSIFDSVVYRPATDWFERRQAEADAGRAEIAPR